MSTKSALPNATGRSDKIRPKQCAMDLATRKSSVTLARATSVEWWNKQKPDCSKAVSERELRNL